MRDLLGDLAHRAAAVGTLGDEVQRLRELDDLPVRAADDPGRHLEAGVLVLADQLDAVGQVRTAV
jgi:hypothetical protein